jgi:2-desacetyl-2-hydroxyethyl bacteriochlorophyllide A dehydrogenase
MMQQRQSVLFTAPYTISIEESPVPEPGHGQALIKTQISAISPGTEMLFYRGQVPEGLAVDDSIAALAGQFSYPLAYGYALVGEVIAVGPQVANDWLGRFVFLFAPHQSYVLANAADLLPLPPGMSHEDAVLLPFMETAVSFLMDGRPLIGERVILFGQGVIGLLTTALLASYPLSALLTVDPIALRRDLSLKLGATAAFDPGAPDFSRRLTSALGAAETYRGADLVYELSGDPRVLNQAIANTGFDGRLIVGSWYGRKTSPIELGGHFHRSQIAVVSSQVSHIAPRWRGRFDKARRLQVAWQMLEKHRPQSLITHKIPFTAAAQAYRLIDEDPHQTVQVVLDYTADQN